MVWRHSAHAQLCVYWFFVLGRVHVISTGPISTVQTEVRGSASSYRRKKTLTSFNQCSAEH
ncbi:unnamed protein product [Staurois parvus]|uniref:Secreted protein n=1 Tax=Staurois parvus TaxID=386267 RepID=A0ABN9FAJ7_9NEOB|nr:unnamed protein product [Staurois parvus]